MTVSFPELSTYRWSCNDTSKRFSVDNPATGRSITTIQGGDASTVDQAVKASQKAFDERWRSVSPAQRSNYLFRCAAELDKHKDELATILCMENGKPKHDALLFDIEFVVQAFRYFGSLTDKLPSEFYDRGSMYCTVIYEPHGVCAGILPFNWPPIHTGGKLAPALAAGNTMILKPGEQAPLTVFRIVEIINQILPEDVVQVIPGLGPEVPSALVEHPLVKMVSFTGSTVAGSAVAKTASTDIKPVVLELGGKNAMIVFEDADFDLSVRDALNGAFFNKGEACTATSRILVQRPIYDQFVAKLAGGVKKLRAGNGLEQSTHVGPCVSKAQQKRVLNYIEIGKKEGATVAAQAPLPSDPACRDGFFVPITLFSDVTETMTLAKEEVFGAVVSVTPFDSFDDAIRIANSVDYGLTAAVYSKDQMKLNRATRALHAGMVWQNNYFRAVLGTPFGGVKKSGYGREHCPETLREWCTAKTIHSLSGMGELPTWKTVRDIYGDSGSDAL